MRGREQRGLRDEGRGREGEKESLRVGLHFRSHSAAIYYRVSGATVSQPFRSRINFARP